VGASMAQNPRIGHSERVNFNKDPGKSAGCSKVSNSRLIVNIADCR